METSSAHASISQDFVCKLRILAGIADNVDKHNFLFRVEASFICNQTTSYNFSGQKYITCIVV